MEESVLYKILGLLAGVIIILVGAYVLISGVRVEGTIDLVTPFISGKMTSGSAGLFLIFSGIIFVAITRAGQSLNDNIGLFINRADSDEYMIVGCSVVLLVFIITTGVVVAVYMLR